MCIRFSPTVLHNNKVVWPDDVVLTDTLPDLFHYGIVSDRVNILGGPASLDHNTTSQLDGPALP